MSGIPVIDLLGCFTVLRQNGASNKIPAQKKVDEEVCPAKRQRKSNQGTEAA
jgi:hypothetical protein